MGELYDAFVEDGKSTMEHIWQIITQSGEASQNEFHKL